MKKSFLLVALVCVVEVFSQQERAITTAVPFLNISADARASGMGDMGVATSADVYSQQWNPSKYAFAEQKVGIGVSYTPFLESIVSDIGLLSANFYNKINERNAFAFGLRFFSLGDIELRQTIDDQGTTVSPNEFAIDGSRCNPGFSGGQRLCGRRIRFLSLPGNCLQFI